MMRKNGGWGEAGGGKAQGVQWRYEFEDNANKDKWKDEKGIDCGGEILGLKGKVFILKLTMTIWAVKMMVIWVLVRIGGIIMTMITMMMV